MTKTSRPTKALAVVLFVAILAACGGGSGGGQPAALEPPANRTPVASAGSAQTALWGAAIALDASASSDPDGDVLSHAWNLAGPAGSAAALTNPTAPRPSFTPDLPGTYVATVTVADGRGASARAAVTITVTAPTIALSRAEPLSGTVKLSLTGAVAGAVEWYADLRLLGSGNGADGHSIDWDTVGVSNGEHQLQARIQPASGSAIDVRRTVNVSNSTVTLNATVSGTTGTIHVDVQAASTTAITAVSATFDVADAGTSFAKASACS